MCLALGYPHPDYLLTVLTGEQYTDWIDYSQREPFGFPIEDLRVAMQMAVTANAAGAELTAADFQMADRLREDPENEDEVSPDKLIQILEKLMPPKPKMPPPPPQE